MKKVIVGVFVLILLASTTAYAARDNRQGRRNNASSTSEFLERFRNIRNASSTEETLRAWFGDRRASSTASSTRPEGGKKNADVACVSAAVVAREGSTITAWNTYNTRITDSLSARKTALTSAWTKTDVKARKEAIKSAWEASKVAQRNASLEYKKSKISTWTTYKKAVKACGGGIGLDDLEEIEIGENFQL